MYFRGFSIVTTVLISAINNFTASPMPASTLLLEQVSIQEDPPGENVEFRIIFGGAGQTKEGQPFAVTVYKSSDGVTVRKTVEVYGNEIAAKQALREESGSCIGETSPDNIISKDASKYENRTVCQTKMKDETIITRIIFASGKYLYKIDSASLNHALLIERNKFRSNPKALSEVT